MGAGQQKATSRGTPSATPGLKAIHADLAEEERRRINLQMITSLGNPIRMGINLLNAGPVAAGTLAEEQAKMQQFLQQQGRR